MTPDGVYTTTRVIHGTTSAVTYLQSTLTHILPQDLLEHTLYWLEYILLHHASIDGLFSAMRKFFTMFKKRNLKLYPPKCCFFATKIKCCG